MTTSQRSILFVALGLSCCQPIVAGESPAIAPYQAPAQVPKTGIGWRGDGSGYFPNSHPPSDWDEATGKNILWKIPVSNWGCASPVPVGNRVFVMSEGRWKTPFPQLTCYDADTGRQVWSRVIDPLDGFPNLTPEERKAAMDDVEVCQGILRRMGTIHGDFIFNKNGHSKTKDSPEVKEVVEKLTAAGFVVKNPEKLLLPKLIGPSSVGMNEETKRRFDESIKRLGKYGIQPVGCTYTCGYADVGTCFSTPVSDGQHIYVMTSHQTVACYDMEGNRKWIQGGLKIPYRGVEWVVASPRLCGDVSLLTLFGGCRSEKDHNRLIGWDKRTGKKLWDVPSNRDPNQVRCDYIGTSTLVMSLPSNKDPQAPRTDVCVTAQGSVVRISDGKILYLLPAPHAWTGWAMDESSGRVFSGKYAGVPGGGDKYARTLQSLSMDGDTLIVKDIYTYEGYASGCPVYAEGRIFGSKFQFNADTGFVTGRHDATMPFVKEYSGVNSPIGKHVILVAGNHVYGLDQVVMTDQPFRIQQGRFEVFGMDGRKKSTAYLRPAPWEGEKLEQWTGQGFLQDYYWYNCRGFFSFYTPMNISGDRLYIRSDDFLYCIGHALKGVPGEDPAQVVAIRKMNQVEQLLPVLVVASAQQRFEAVQGLIRLGTKARPAMERLSALVRTDPYEEIRAAAALALDGADAEAKSGTALLQSLILARTPKTDAQEDEHLARTVGLLGSEGMVNVLAPLLGMDRKMAERQAAIPIAGAAGRIGGHAEARIVEALIQIVLTEKADPWGTPLTSVNALTTMHADPKRLQRLLEEQGPKIALLLQTPLYLYVSGTMSSDEAREFAFALAKNDPPLRADVLKTLLALPPASDNLKEWLISESKKGDPTCIAQLVAVIGPEKTSPVLAGLLQDQRSTVVTAASKLAFSSALETEKALAAMLRILPDLSNSKNKYEEEAWVRALDPAFAARDSKIQALAVEAGLKYLARDKALMSALVLGQFAKCGAVAKPALDTLRPLAAGSNKEIAAAAAAAIKAIESAAGSAALIDKPVSKTEEEKDAVQ